MLGINTDVERVWLFYLIVSPMFALREFILCEKQKAKAFSSCQPPSLEELGSKASSSTYYPQKIPQSNCLKTLKKNPLNLL